MQAEFQCSYSLQLLLGNEQQIPAAHFHVYSFAFPSGNVLVSLQRSGGTTSGVVSLGQAQCLPIGQSLSWAKSGVRRSWLPVSVMNLPRVRKLSHQTILSKRLSWVFGTMCHEPYFSSPLTPLQHQT